MMSFAVHNNRISIFFSLLLPKIRIRIGEWDFSSTSEPMGSVELKVVDKIVHPKYNFFTYEYDLALVKLERRIDFQENIIPICLPGNEDLLVGKTLFINHFWFVASLLTNEHFGGIPSWPILV